MANEGNEKTLSTCIDELSEKTELTDTDNILIKSKGVNALKTTLLAIFHYINQKLELGALAAKNKIEKSDLDVSLSLELESAFDSKLDISQKGAVNGVAELDSNGFIHAVQLPSFVDDVIEGYLYTNGNFYNDEAHTNEILAESGKIYIDLTGNINKTYRWSGTAYVVISDTITLGETEGTAFRGDKGKLAYEHTLPENGTNPHGTTKVDVGLGNVENVTASDAVITYTEPDTPSEGDTEIIPASGSTLKVVIGWLMKKIKTISIAISALSQSFDALNRNIEVTFLDKSFGGVVGCPLYYCKYTKILYCSTVITGTFANGANMGLIPSSQIDLPNSVRQIPFLSTNTDGTTSYAQLSISTSGNISLHNSVDKAMLNPVISGFCLLGYI